MALILELSPDRNLRPASYVDRRTRTLCYNRITKLVEDRAGNHCSFRQSDVYVLDDLLVGEDDRCPALQRPGLPVVQREITLSGNGQPVPARR